LHIWIIGVLLSFVLTSIAFGAYETTAGMDRISNNQLAMLLADPERAEMVDHFELRTRASIYYFQGEKAIYIKMKNDPQFKFAIVERDEIPTFMAQAWKAKIPVSAVHNECSHY
jgi:hypothetical protein